jgi:hypothetical protein
MFIEQLRATSISSSSHGASATKWCSDWWVRRTLSGAKLRWSLLTYGERALRTKHGLSSKFAGRHLAG